MSEQERLSLLKAYELIIKLSTTQGYGAIVLQDETDKEDQSQAL